MNNEEAPPVTQDEAPTGLSRLTRRALYDLTLEEMRRHGKPTDDMSDYTEDNDERGARALALFLANRKPGDTERSEAERKRLQEGGSSKARGGVGT